MAENGERVAQTTPSKSFFVSMLTRDIELEDAILDLLDNCIDGAVRIRNSTENETQSFHGYWAKLTLSGTRFSITDNCGGIPIGIAKQRAFRLGRPQFGEEDELGGKTVGVYGIGMKRAIFKLGRDATVTSNGPDPFKVHIDADWLDSDDWQSFDLSTHNPAPNEPSGTDIYITELFPAVGDKLGSRDWIEQFRKHVASHYALILAKGFEVRIVATGVSGRPIRGTEFALAVTGGHLGGEGIQPFIYRGEIDNVGVQIFAGLLRKPLTPSEIQDAKGEDTRRSAAGWTIACNDRVVLSRDRTYLTGWGTGGVASYHGQFSVIAGIALLYADEVQNLPLTTTKRGIEISSAVYDRVLRIMRTATKKLTAFTNAYKTDAARQRLLGDARNVSLAKLRAFEKLTTVNKGRLSGFATFIPDLPKPSRERRTPSVTFNAEAEEITALREFFEEEELSNNKVGRLAFEYALEHSGFSDQ